MRLFLTLATLAALTGASPTLAAQIDDRGAIAIAKPQPSWLMIQGNGETSCSVAGEGKSSD